MSSPSPVRIAIAALAALALAGCSGGVSRDSAVYAGSGARTAGSPATTPAAQSDRPSRTRAAVPRTSRYALADLKDADATRVDVILGPPDIVRREGAGEMRIYRNTSCVVHVFMYPRAGNLTAAHVEARARQTRLDDAQARACIGTFS